MSAIAPPKSRCAMRADTRLRLVPMLAEPTDEVTAGKARAGNATAIDAPSSPAHVLVVGADAGARMRMLEELRGLLPADTPFQEACEAWQVLARAAGSRMVVLTDGLDGLSVDALARLLARRHPSLPVLSVTDRSSPVSSAGQYAQ